MNRRSLLINGFQAAGAVVLAAVARPFASAKSSPTLMWRVSVDSQPALNQLRSLADQVRPRLVVGHAFVHPAIQANIDYWMKVAPDWLAEFPPRHTSYYAVKEHGHLRVYAVKWNGSNLNDRSVWIPTNEREQMIEVQNQITLSTKQIRRHSPYPDEGMDIGDSVYFSIARPMQICSYVFDSPCRRIKKWQMSNATALLAADKSYQLHQQDFKA